MSSRDWPGPARSWGDRALKVSGHLLRLRTAAWAPGPGGKGAREEAAASQAWCQPAWGTSRRVSGFIRKKCAPPLNVTRWCKYVPAIFGTHLYLKRRRDPGKPAPHSLCRAVPTAWRPPCPPILVPVARSTSPPPSSFHSSGHHPWGAELTDMKGAVRPTHPLPRAVPAVHVVLPTFVCECRCCARTPRSAHACVCASVGAGACLSAHPDPARRRAHL